jgi:hypothetical protein
MSKRFIRNVEYPHLKLPFHIAANVQQVNKLIVEPRRQLSKSKREYKQRKNRFYRTKISSTLKDNLFIYKNQENAFNHSLNYMFFKIGVGIYVNIINNEVKMFVPFANMNFTNDWYPFITYEQGITDIKIFNKKYKIRDKVFHNPQQWNANNCLIGNQREDNGFPISANRTEEIYNLLVETCKRNKVKDVEFFVNKRDFPVLKRNLTEPYHHIFNSRNRPIRNHRYKSYLPIFSMSSSEDFADIMLPTDDDIALYFKEKHFTNKIKSPEWEEKKPIALFRGGATGCGTTTKNNQRLKLAELSLEIKELDAQVTSWNKRPKKYYNDNLSIIEPRDLSFKLGDKMTIEEQVKYKYLIQVDGHVSAFRLSWMMQSLSTILLVESTENYSLWFQSLLKPWRHYVPVKADMSDLQEKINWCINNDSESKRIAQRAYRVYEKYVRFPLEYVAYALNLLPNHETFV